MDELPTGRFNIQCVDYGLPTGGYTPELPHRQHPSGLRAHTRYDLGTGGSRMLLHKAPWMVPIPGTTKLSHLEENLLTPNFQLADSEWNELEQRVSAIPVVGDRYNAEQQKQVGF